MSEDVYSNPENYGLKILAEASEDEAYQFNMFVVWEDCAGGMYYADDSGCSCPSPFEEFMHPAGLNKLKWETFNQDLDKWVQGYSHDDYEDSQLKRRRQQADQLRIEVGRKLRDWEKV